MKYTSRRVNASEKQGKVVKPFKWQVEGTFTLSLITVYAN